MFVIFRTISNISFEGEDIINLRDLEVENEKKLDQTDSAEGDVMNSGIAFENTNFLDKSHEIDRKRDFNYSKRSI